MFKKFDFYQFLIFLLSVAIIAVIAFLVYTYSTGMLGKTAVKIETAYAKGSVNVNGKITGETPFYRDLPAGELNLTLSADSGSYSGSIRPAAGTKAVIKRDVGVGGVFSSGQNIWLTKSSSSEPSISVVTPDVSEVTVIVDGVETGKTPLKIKTSDLLSKNEDNKYKLNFKKDGYEEQEVIVTLYDGYELNVRVDMFLIPIPKGLTSLSNLTENVNFVNFANVADPHFADKKLWAKGINYWLQTRGALDLGNYKVDKFDLFITDDGKVYNSSGNEVIPEEVKPIELKFAAYLATAQASDITTQASEVIQKFGGSVPSSLDGSTSGLFKVEISKTSVGFLRVRNNPSTTGAEVAKVNPGAKFDVLEEKSSWYKIEYESGKTGWISGTYTRKL
jgi:hypothetical protein